MDTKNSCEGLNDQTTIEAFIVGLPIGLLRHRLKCDKVTDLGEMIETASKYADADDDAEGLLNALVVPQSAKQPKQQAQKRKNISEEKPNALLFPGLEDEEDAVEAAGVGMELKESKVQEINN